MALGMRLMDALRGVQPYGTPPFNPAAPKFGLRAMGLPPPPMNPEAAAKPNKGLFGIRPGSKGALIAGILGDALAGASGGEPRYMQHLAAERQRKAEEEQWNRRREAEREDMRWKWDNEPNRQAPTEFERALEASGVQRGTPEWGKAFSRRVENILNPMTVMQTTDAYGNPAVVSVPRNGYGAGQPQQPAIGAVLPDPRKAGGGAGNSTGGFRR